MTENADGVATDNVITVESVSLTANGANGIDNAAADHGVDDLGTADGGNPETLTEDDGAGATVTDEQRAAIDEMCRPYGPDGKLKKIAMPYTKSYGRIRDEHPLNIMVRSHAKGPFTFSRRS